jgi:hypothetical protein
MMMKKIQLRPMLHLPYRKKRNLLLLFIFFLFCFLFYRGFALHLVDSINTRIRYHALPVAISVLYHKHPHDYTGLRIVELPFQGGADAKDLLKSAVHQDVGQSKDVYYWVADDKGFEDYVIAAFSLFGPYLSSLFYMWFLLLALTTTFYIITFGKNIGALGFLALAYLGLHLAISALPMASMNLASGVFSIDSVTIYETRYLDILAFIPVIYMMLLALRRKPLTWLKEIIPLVAQLFLFINLYHCRSSLGWEAVCVLFFCLAVTGYRFFKQMKSPAKNKILYKKITYSNAIIVAGSLVLCLLGLNIYKHIFYNPHYFDAMGKRTIWHNALMGLSQVDADLAQKYHLSINDFMIAESVIKYAQKSGKCRGNISNLEPQQLLNTLGGWGVADWPNYENCARSYYFSIISQNKSRILYIYAIQKPLNALETLFVVMRGSGNPVYDATVSQYNLGWNPVSSVNLGIYLIILLLSFRALARARVKFIGITSTIFLFSFIPSVAFYNAILTLGGFFVSAAMLVYLMGVACFYKKILR